METFEQIAYESFGALTINKALARKAAFGSRAIPVYVREWIVANFVGDSLDLTEEARAQIAEFVHLYLPDKGERESVKNQLFEQRDVKLLDDYSVVVDLAKGDRFLVIPYLDVTKAAIPPRILQENDMLLSSGIWGVGTLAYAPPMERTPGQVLMRSFKPFQLANLDLEYFISQRKNFTTQEWIDFLVNSMGFNHKIYSERQKVLLISRLLPMVEPRYNLVELAPKGTGKSFVYENMSRYVAVRSGAISAPVLFYNEAKHIPGIITRYDCVVIDEAQKVKGDASGELVALLKSYLEAGRFSRGSAASVSAEAGIVILANIDLDDAKRPVHELIGLFRVFPNFLRETAFLDRISGLLPGWDLPRISKETPSVCVGLKGDIFGEILHMLRSDISHRDYVKLNMHLDNCDDMRDSKAIEAGATGLLKILFPDKDPTDEEFYKYCVNPALEYRQRVRDELSKLDREFTPISMRSIMPDEFQRYHNLVSYVEPNEQVMAQVMASREASEGPSQKMVEVDDMPVRGEMELDVMEEVEEGPVARTIHIREGETGHSYKSLFADYLKGATEITVVDPYIRMEFQVKNFLAFLQIIDASKGPVKVALITAADDAYQEGEITKKLDEIRHLIERYGILLTFEFSTTVHRRGITADNGWKIVIDRGLDIYQKPISKYELGELDQTKRSCRETEIVYLRE